MTPPEPNSPNEPNAEEPSERESQQPDYLTDPAATEQAFQQIVSELSDLSMNDPNDETKRAVSGQSDAPTFDFPSAPWVDRPTAASERSTPGRGPRDWDDDLDALEQIDAFVEPDPKFELSHDPVRNLGWFLVTISLVGMLLTALFTRPQHGPTLLILGAMLIVGAGLLVWRMPNNPLNGSGGGAQV